MSDQKKSLLPFQRSLIEGILEDDTLCVLAPGLGLQQAVAALLRLQEARTTADCSTAGVAIILGCAPWQRDMLRRELQRVAGNTCNLPLEVTNEVASSERERLYRSRASVFVTTRILVVDLLSGRISPKEVAGVFVLNAHRSTDTSGEAFAIKLLKDGHRSVFVRAFTDNPVALSGEFSGVEKVIKALHVKVIHIWPRFQAQVQVDLEHRPPELIELSQVMTANMAAIYEAISILMDACVKELRKSNKLDTTDLTVSSGLFRSFDESIRRQLAPIWHTVSPKTKQIVADLRTLRTLATYLLRFDAVTYLSYLDTLRQTEGIKSVWLFHSAAHIIFEAAKGRVYELGNVKNRNADGASGLSTSVAPVLEEPPKWGLLKEVIDEIKKERLKMLEIAEASDGGILRAAAEAPILIVCADTFTVAQLQQMLAKGDSGGFMRRLYQEYLQRKLDSRGVTKKVSHAPESAAPQLRMMGGYRPGEEQAILKEAKAFDTSAVAVHSADQKKKTKKQKVQSNTLQAATTAASLTKAATMGNPTALPSPDTDIQFLALDTHNVMLLWESQPSFIILYDPEPAITRQVELYKAQRPGLPCRIYLLRYEDSVEMDKFQAAIAREKSAFESLIKSKEIMILPSTVHSTVQPSMDLNHDTGSLVAFGDSNNALTRRAGGRLIQRAMPKKVIIDVREFMSSLPAVLHSKGLELIPLTLEVGDYVLSPEMCVERKSLPDLKGSLLSGRLYTQAEAMVKHYKTPILLIEFEGDKAFALGASSEVDGEIGQLHSLMSKIALLCLHFPRLRLIWSRSLHATADLFQNMKANYDEPDPVTAATVGVPIELGGVATTASMEAVINQAAVDILRTLPGVTEANMRPLMKAAGNLTGLIALPLEQLVKIMGGQKAAKRLRDFLDQECAALFKAL